MNFVHSLGQYGKAAGQFFTPEPVAKTLVTWVVRSPEDTLLDPSCGDGAIIEHHRNSKGVEQDPYSAWLARERCPGSEIENNDFLTWAAETRERFDCAAGNPPFIRYQSFKGTSKRAAQTICRDQGVEISGLTSSWAVFLIATASLLKRGGRMAFVVPAEIGHASYARPIIRFLLGRFSKVQIVAIRAKLFPKLSEDCWLLYCDGYGFNTPTIEFSAVDSFERSPRPPTSFETLLWSDVEDCWGGRLRPFLVSSEARQLYLRWKRDPLTRRFGDFARIGIGYITGDNGFFHLSKSEATKLGIPDEFLIPTVRRGRSLDGSVIDNATICDWEATDQPCFLLNIPPNVQLPETVSRYLESDRALSARASYKCRKRSCWYSVPGVTRPDYFLQYMSGNEVTLAKNVAGATCTNSVHAVQVTNAEVASRVMRTWGSPFVKLSCELEGHPLGGGMLKLEPREAARIRFPDSSISPDLPLATAAIDQIRKWRHVG